MSSAVAVDAVDLIVIGAGAGGNRGGMTDNSDQIAVSARFDPENTETILGVAERDMLNKARQYFLSRGFLLGFHQCGFCRRLPLGISRHSATLASLARVPLPRAS